MNVSSPRLVACLTNPTFRAGLARFVRSRVPDAEVDDIVQATLSDALEAPRHPDADDEISRWVYGICRHKVVDSFRRMRREVPSDLLGDEEAASPASAPTGAMDLAKNALPHGPEHEQTLEWMLREGEGEKLDVIAREAEVPAPRVRQRVSRLRRHFKARWAVEVAALAVLLLALALILRGRHETEVAPRPEPSLEPSPTVREAPPTIAPAMSTTPPVPSASAATPSPSAVTPPVPSAVPTSMPAPRPSSVPSMPTTEERPRPRSTRPIVPKPGGGSSI
jgi:DNA-directed RNA polymerase specialized sigma24 family protein